MRARCFEKATALMLAAILWPASAAWAQPVIEGAWLRAVPPVSKSTAGYLTLRNPGAEDICLTGVSADFAGHAMLHSMAAGDDGVRRMRHLARITVPAGGEVTFAPGGLHVMLTGLKRVPVEGGTETLCLEFARQPTVCAPFPVQRAP